MAEYIEREAAIQAASIWNGDEGTEAWIQTALRKLPAADVRPVVLCKDCEYCKKIDEFEYWCYGFCSPARLVRKDDFCSHGKMKE